MGPTRRNIFRWKLTPKEPVPTGTHPRRRRVPSTEIDPWTSRPPDIGRPGRSLPGRLDGFLDRRIDVNQHAQAHLIEDRLDLAAHTANSHGRALAFQALIMGQDHP